MNSLPLDPDTDRFLQNELQPGETVRWSGCPVRSRLVLRALPMLIPVVIWFSLVGWMLTSAGRHGGHPPPTPFSLLLVGIGLLVVAQPLWTLFSASRVAYAVTSQRAVIISPRPFGGMRVQSFPPTRLGADECVARPDGSGDLILATFFVRGRNATSQRKIGFFGLPELEPARAAVRALAKGVPQDLSPRPAPTPPAQRIFGAVMGGVFAAVGIGVIILGARTALEGRRSLNWPTATGTVIHSEATIAPGKGTSYQPHVLYRYSVGEATYRGDRIAVMTVPGLETRALDIVDRYPAGAAVTVRYDPVDPRKSVLEPGVSFNAWIMPGLGLFFVAFGSLFAGLSLKANRAGSPPVPVA